MFAMPVMTRRVPDPWKRGRDISCKLPVRQRGRAVACTSAHRHHGRMIATVAELEASLAAAEPPAELDSALKALWHAAKGNWDTAHELAQAQDDARGAWVHAYLHRVEGDQSNAGYWYRRAGRPHSTAPLQAEWQEIVRALLNRP
jgi:hypothetical protein